LSNGKIIPIDKRDIVFVFVKDKDVFVRTKTGEFSSLLTLQEFENILTQSDETNFLRIHRQYIVNLDEVSEIAPWFHGSYLLRLNDVKKQEVPVSRNRVKVLKSMMGLK
jgi:two-component system LytT family response regulator/two-component system response regulator LytT